MTELATYTPAANTATMPAQHFDPTGGRLVAWAAALHAAHQIGTALCQTSFVPAAFRGKPEEAAAMILYGDELGLTPGTSLQSGFVVSGRPGLYARAMHAIVLSKGHEVWVVEKSDAKVTVAGRRKGSTSIHEETWTTGRAQKAGYTSNKKYSTDPQAMLYARALADVCRIIAPDALAGLDYTIEELELMELPATTTVTRATQTPAKTTVQRKPAAMATPAQEPELEAHPVPAAPEPELRTEAQSKHLWTLISKAGMSEDEARAYISATVGREVESSKSLTKAEAHTLIESLLALTDGLDDEPEPDGDGVIA